MAEIISNIEDVVKKGKINVYAVCYNHRRKDDNCSVALPSNMNYDLRRDFCDNIIGFKGAREVNYNPTADGLENDTYEYIDLTDAKEKWDEIHELLNHSFSFRDSENRKKVPLSNLFICELDYNNHRYFLCAKQGSNSEKLLRGKLIWTRNVEKLEITKPGEAFVMSTYVSFVIDNKESKILVFNKKAFQDVFDYDNYQKEKVQSEIDNVNSWSFLESTELIKQKVKQKNVYQNLARIFADKEYMKQISKTKPNELKNNLLKGCPKYFTKKDFHGDCLIVTQKNLGIVMKMLAKGFKFNFFINSAEE